MTAKRERTGRRKPAPPTEPISPRPAALLAAQKLAANRPGTVVIPQDDGTVLVANHH